MNRFTEAKLSITVYLNESIMLGEQSETVKTMSPSRQILKEKF